MGCARGAVEAFGSFFHDIGEEWSEKRREDRGRDERREKGKGSR
jgi:hypothetical protein